MICSNINSQPAVPFLSDNDVKFRTKDKVTVTLCKYFQLIQSEFQNIFHIKSCVIYSNEPREKRL